MSPSSDDWQKFATYLHSADIHWNHYSRNWRVLKKRDQHGTRKPRIHCGVPQAQARQYRFHQGAARSHSHGSTIEEARETLRGLAALIFDEQGRGEQMVAGENVMREPVLIPVPLQP